MEEDFEQANSGSDRKPLLTRAISVARRHIEAASTPQERWRALWASAKHARRLAANDVIAEEFTELGKQMGFAKGSGRSADDLRHVIDWACRGLNPFHQVPLQ